ncbi:MAG: hypothetical protein ABIJ41_07995 [Candidatus Omnitrophota bacterium]
MSFFPDPQRQGDIKFIFFKDVPYLTRMQCIIGLFIGGFLIQLFLNFIFGLILIGLGTAFSLIQGYSAKPKTVTTEEWKQVTPDEYKKVRSKQKQLERWDRDAFDITNPLGIAVVVLIGVVCFIIWMIIEGLGQHRLASYWTWDVLLILAPHWITGTRSFLRKDRLIIKIELLEKIMDYLREPSDIQVLPMLSTCEAQKGGRIPMDARLLVRILDAPDFFLGLQIQISINTVEGRDYPYLYCVFIAKQGADILRKKKQLIERSPSKLTLEKTTSVDVDVLVIRQKTTRNSEYHTNLSASKHIVQAALDLTRQLLKDEGVKRS